jgi:hypothetical protein
MMSANKHSEAQMRDIEYIAEKIKAAKRAIGPRSPSWAELDLAEGRLRGLAIFTSLDAQQEADAIIGG